MAIFFHTPDRKVIPNFRSFSRTAELNEINSFQTKQYQRPKIIINNQIDDWNQYKTIGHAADLISVAFAGNVTNQKPVIDAAEFVLENQYKATKSQLDLASMILGSTPDTPDIKKLSKIDDFILENNRRLIYDRISQLKTHTSISPLNAINYVEMARLYSIIGQLEKSKKCINIALSLAPGNRYVVRSYARLFFHYGENDVAHDVLRTNSATIYDPWLLSAEIAFASYRGRNSRFIKQGLEMIKSKKYSLFSLTELASSIATIELLNGSIKKSKDLFHSSLKAPNDNSLAQAEWASEKNEILKVNPFDFELSNSYEAYALENYSKKNWEGVISNTEKWFIDMAYSKSPILLGSYVASTFLDDHKKAILFTEAGLISNPNDVILLNNKAYYLAILKDIDEADKFLLKAKATLDIDDVAKICLTATEGLIALKRGDYEKGKNFYLKAIEDARSIKNQHLTNLAMLNFINQILDLNFHNSEIEIIERLLEKVKPENGDFNNLLFKEKTVSRLKKIKNSSYNYTTKSPFNLVLPE